MRLILVRHGETEYNHEYRVQGQSDIPLNESGKRQAGLLAQALQHEAVEAIYTSPLQRAAETAEAIDRFHRVPIRKLDGLKELDAGEVDGLYYPDIASKYPEFHRIWVDVADQARLPGGESLPELQARVWDSIQSIVDADHSSTVVVVSHFFALLCLLCKVLDLSLSEFRRMSMTVGSISILDLPESPGGKIKLVAFNDTCHLG